MKIDTVNQKLRLILDRPDDAFYFLINDMQKWATYRHFEDKLKQQYNGDTLTLMVLYNMLIYKHL